MGLLTSCGSVHGVVRLLDETGVAQFTADHRRLATVPLVVADGSPFAQVEYLDVTCCRTVLSQSVNESNQRNQVRMGRTGHYRRADEGRQPNGPFLPSGRFFSGNCGSIWLCRCGAGGVFWPLPGPAVSCPSHLVEHQPTQRQSK